MNLLKTCKMFGVPYYYYITTLYFLQYYFYMSNGFVFGLNDTSKYNNTLGLPVLYHCMYIIVVHRDIKIAVTVNDFI